jgi:hypothetical protein
MAKTKSSSANQKRSPDRFWSYLLVFLILLSFALIRLRFLDCPLERDEGEYAYAGQLILQGYPPYQLAYNMKLPGTYAAYAALMAVFGQTASGIHLGMLFINLATALLVFLLGARLFSPAAGIVACASYSLLSIGQSVLGTSGHATHFVILPALGGLLLLLRGIERPRNGIFFWSGILAGLAFLMKQPGIVFAIFTLLYYSWSALRQRPIAWRGVAVRGGMLALGAILPFCLTCLGLKMAGVFDRFWFWTFSYAREYATSITLLGGVKVLASAAPKIIAPALGIWSVAAAGLIGLFWNREARAKAPFLVGFLVFSFIGVCPGFHFREHYFVLMLPAAALLAGAAVSVAEREARRFGSLAFIPTLVFIAVFGYAILRQSGFLFEMSPLETCRSLYGLNPFPEAIEVAKYIQAQTSPADRIAVLGSEPEIYFYSKRHSATGHIYTYGLMEEQPYAPRMQREMIGEIEAARPKYLVMVNVSVSWLPHPGSDRTIFSWADDYIRHQYTLDGFVDILSENRTIYRWGADAQNYEPRSPFNLQVLKRR